MGEYFYLSYKQVIINKLIYYELKISHKIQEVVGAKRKKCIFAHLYGGN